MGGRGVEPDAKHCGTPRGQLQLPAPASLAPSVTTFQFGTVLGVPDDADVITSLVSGTSEANEDI